MSTLCLLFGDQLNLNMSSLARLNKAKDHVLLAEVRAEASYVKHHKIKIAFLFSAMRHFRETLVADGYQVSYIDYEHKDNKGNLFEQVQYFCKETPISKLVLAKPGEYRLSEDISSWQERLKIEVEITPDNRFLAAESDFSDWANARKQLRMEYFYREMRQKHQYLMEDGKPIGGKWNYDADNRQKLPKDVKPPKPTTFDPDDITKGALALVKREFDDHFGDLENFHYAVTREQALTVLKDFIEQRLENFGRYQDAMVQDEPWLFHSHISFYLNAGLLMPDEVLEAAQAAFYSKKAPINSVEGFIRQILGWREYVRGFYWHFMPNLKTDNYLEAKQALPNFFWTGDTQMNCISQSVKQTKEHAYAHHIQRLMILGNFALLAGLDPDEVNEWYLIVYADAYEWVELPNVSGMVLFADGGQLASKPYAASGAYVNKMSNYCANCHYNVKEKTGSQACPFNYLYWGFMQRHQRRFEGNPRMAMMYRTMSKMDPTQLRHMAEDTKIFIKQLND